MTMLNHTTEEVFELVSMGFMPGYMGDVTEGDIISIAPVTRFNFEGPEKRPEMYTIERVIRTDGSYRDEDDQLRINVVLNITAWNEFDLPIHLSYGSTYPCYILSR